MSCLVQTLPTFMNFALLRKAFTTTGINSLLQARLTYELAMANKDASSVEEAAARDYDDRLSDDSSGEIPVRQPASTTPHQQAHCDTC